MKRLRVFLAALLMTASSIAMAHYCSDVAGTWSVGSTTLICTQSSPGSFSCPTVTFAYGNGTCHATYAGTGFSDTTGESTYTATYVSGTCPYATTWSGWITMSNSCTTMSDATIGNNITRTKGMDGTTGSACEVPGTSGNHGELTPVLDGWDSTWPAIALVHASLSDASDSNFNFGGRSTQENITVQTGWNGCTYPLATPTGNDVWTPSADWNYSVGLPEDDGNGFKPAGQIYINYVQEDWLVVLPCTLTIRQQMSIDCPSTQSQYDDHNIIYKIDDGTFTVDHNSNHSNPQTRNWGVKRTIEKWWAFYFWTYPWP